MKAAFKYTSFIILVFLSLFLTGQTRKDLEQKLEANKKASAVTKQILEQIKSKEMQGLAGLVLIEKQMEQRISLVSSMGKQVEQLDKLIGMAQKDISALTHEIEDMKAEFARLLYTAYKMKHQQTTMHFLLSSTSFNQVLKRIRYLKDLVEYRKKQLALIVLKQRENSANINALIRKKNTQLDLVEEKKIEMEKLKSDEEASRILLEELKGKISELQQKLAEQKKVGDELDKAIKKAIEEEIKREEEERKKRLADRNREGDNHEVASIRGSTFGKNQGALMWPVEYGYISEKFGIHKHPKLKNITTENNGVNIATRDGEMVRCVFAGKVSAVMQVPGMKNSVLVKHGNYYTVYANLDETHVLRGENIERGESLGKVKQGENGISEFHFEIWKESVKLNPELWLSDL